MISKLINKWNNISRGAKSAFIYTFATVFSRGLAIITVPIFTRMMTTEEIGIVNLYNSWYSMISVVATLSLTSGGFSVAMKEYEGRRDEYMSSVLTITSLTSVLLAVVYLINPAFWSNILGLPKSLIALMLFGFFAVPARDFWLARQRYEYKYKLSGIMTIGTAVVATALSIFTVLKMKQIESGYIAESRLFANYFVIYGVAMIIWISLFVKGKTFYNKEFWKLSLSLSIPLIGHAMASQILNVSDRMMISKMVGNAEVGIYSTLYTISSISLMIWSAINSAFIPYLFKNIDYKEKRKDAANVGILLVSVYAILAVLMTFFAPEIVRILATEEYYEAIYIMPPIAAGVFLTAVSNTYSNILLYYKKTYAIMISTMTGAVINIILNLICIPQFGYIAAAYTTLVAYIVFAVMQGFSANKVYKKVTNEKKFIYNNFILILISVITITVSLLGIVLYQYLIMRYIVICFGIGILLFYIVKKREKLKQMGRE